MRFPEESVPLALQRVERASARLAAASIKRDEAIELAVSHHAVQSDLDAALRTGRMILSDDPGLSMALVHYRHTSQTLDRYQRDYNAASEHAATCGATPAEIADNTATRERPANDVPTHWFPGRKLLKLRPHAPLWQVLTAAIVLLAVALIALIAAAVAISLVAGFALLGLLLKEANSHQKEQRRRRNRPYIPQ